MYISPKMNGNQSINDFESKDVFSSRHFSNKSKINKIREFYSNFDKIIIGTSTTDIRKKIFKEFSKYVSNYEDWGYLISK